MIVRSLSLLELNAPHLYRKAINVLNSAKEDLRSSSKTRQTQLRSKPTSIYINDLFVLYDKGWKMGRNVFVDDCLKIET